MATNKLVVQSAGKAALKTFLQAFLAVFGPLSIAMLNGYVSTVQAGGEVVVDFNIWTNVLLGGLAGGIAGLISLLWNWAKTP